jgi:uncharacterized membrane protein
LGRFQPHLLHFFVIGLAAILVYSPALTLFYYHPDELMHTVIAKGSSMQDVWQRGLQEMHPPGAHFIRHIAMSMNDTITTNRLLSIVPGVLAVLLIYSIGTVLTNPGIGLLLASIQLFSPISVTYSMSIRNYSIYIFFLYIAILLLVLYLRDRQQRLLILYAFFLFLACTTHFSGFIVATATGSMLAYLIIREKDGKLLRLCLLGIL